MDCLSLSNKPILVVKKSMELINMQVGWSDTGLVGLKCDLSTGLVCRNKGQPKGRQCTDFQVRFFCDCGFPTTLPASPTTPVPTPAIEILSTRPPCAYWSNWIDKSHPGRKGHDDELELGFQHHKELNEFCKEVSHYSVAELPFAFRLFIDS